MKIICVIPARYKSSRFPGKPLADIHGKPMIWWVYRRAAQVPDFAQVLVATADGRIMDACKSLDMPCILTSDAHPTGTDRVGEVASRVPADLYVNVQGDEPLISPATIFRAIDPSRAADPPEVTNLMTEIKKTSDLASATVPKVVTNARGDAMYLSRSAVPFPKDPIGVRYFKQVCVYGFTPASLAFFCAHADKGPAERAEDIELLRFIEHGIRVRMLEVEQDTVAVDTPSDLKIVRGLLEGEKP